MTRWLRSFALAAAAAALLLAGCATPQLDALHARPPAGLPRQAQVAGVPIIEQQDKYCGPASLAMVLNWSGETITQEAVAKQIYTPGKEGTLREDMLGGARRHGQLAVKLDRLDDVLRELDAGHPVIVFQNLAFSWYPQWHFAVATGYDLDAGDGGEIVLHSGMKTEHRLPLSTFELTWARGDHWALVVLPPDTLPATAGEHAVVQAAVALERVGQPQAAAQAYAAVLKRWPASLGGAIGLGNARYAAGDKAGAERAFREATERHPDSPAAWNNLATVLSELGRSKEAEAAARRAIALAGEDAEPYRQTLREIAARNK
ncbi:MAG TPA: PA2778 family cysteine peptidase [Alphaproteobacteria bacterium]|nr:PA2778 family cysteine peptidase [Alphaproteobacteria bacterium]